MTSLRLMFIHESQFSRRPLYVSPDFSSTSIGEFSAALRSDNGNILLGYTSFQLNIQYAFSCFRKILLGLLEVELINCAVCVSTI
mmetsp:Transcript_14700/g.22048  ORF Transcript_14700/g.22048 Transcript_14700/m.22048 type:complete len:85 (+) Transcript_14700:274-528(+)